MGRMLRARAAVAVMAVAGVVMGGGVVRAADTATGKKDGGWTVLFRSDNPAIWNTAAGKVTDANGYAMPLEKAPEATRFFRLKRMDTGEYIILTGSVKEVTGRQGVLVWSNGTQSWTAGSSTAYLLGAADQACNTRVAGDVVVLTTQNHTDVGYEGWGFGRTLGNAGVQGYSWGGKPLGKTVFEMAATAGDLTEEEKAWVVSPGTTTLLAATWGSEDEQADVKEKIVGITKGSGYSLRATPGVLGPPPGTGTHSLRVLFNIDGEDHYRVYREGEAVGIMGSATRVLGKKERAAGDLRITAATWTGGSKSVDVTDRLRAAMKGGGLEMDATVANLADPAEGSVKSLEVHYELGGRQLVGRFVENDHVSLGEQVVPVIALRGVQQDQALSSASGMKAGSGGGAKVAAAAGPAAKLGRAQATIKSLMVVIQDDGRMLGDAEDFILTASPGAMNDNTPVNFVGKVGDGMTGVRDDVVRYLHVKHPQWPASKIDLTFEEREVNKDGGSIGAAIGTLLLSSLEGFDIDPGVAITGDVSADGKVRPIGGVGAKLRGAAAAGSTMVLIPAGNFDQLVDSVVYDGNMQLINTHVIGVSNLDEAAAAARTDRPENLAAAVSLFEEIRPELKKFPEHVHTKAMQDTLQKIVTLVPNDYSAKLLLAAGQNKQVKKLSSTATLYYMSVADREVGPSLRDRSKLDKIKSTTTPVAVQQGLTQLYKLRGIGALEVMPLIDAEVRLIQGINSVETGAAAPATVLPLIQTYEDAEAKLKSDRDWMEKLLKGGI